MTDAVLDRLTRTLGSRYVVERELGAGGMATVYLARDVRHGRKVALKVLHPELSAVIGPERFLKEIELTASLQHPHILPLFDSGDADGQLFYVMPFVDGETLRGRLDRETQLPISDALRLAIEVADALQYAHERGVIHRDIKPENILLQGGHALVADFGIALAVQQAGGQRMTQTGLSLGTPQYMAPEQAMGEKSVDARADIYALGAVTYEMLAGEPPFTGPSAQTIIARVLTSDAPALSAVRKSVPEHVADAVHRALEKLPADRFSDARTFANALTGAAATADTAARRSRVDARASAGLGRVLAWSGLTLASGVLGGWAIARVGTRSSATTSAPLTVSARDVHLAPPRWLALANEQDARTLDMQEMDWQSLTPRGPRTRLIGDMRSAGGEFTLALAADVMVYLPGSIDLPYLEFDAGGVLRDSVRINGTWTIDVHQAGSGVTKVAVGGNLGGLWLYDLEGDRDTRLIVRDSGGPARRMLGGTYPLFSRDGTRLVYMVLRPTRCDIVVRDLATDVERVALHTPRVGVCPQLLQWPGDEREVLAESDSVLRAIPLDGSPSRVVVARQGRSWDARISPDGRTIAYSSDESGRPEIYVRPIAAGTPTRVSAGGGRWPRWGTTNGMLYFLSPDGQVMVTRMAGGGTARAPEPRVLFTVNKVGRGLFGDRGIGFAMSGDGQRFFIRQSPSGSALTIARPWTQLLRRADSARVTTAPQP